ncbi:hypothetical protein GCK32_019301, partial [Trichostrongylus colubriformis]
CRHLVKPKLSLDSASFLDTTTTRTKAGSPSSPQLNHDTHASGNTQQIVSIVFEFSTSALLQSLQIRSLV